MKNLYVLLSAIVISTGYAQVIKTEKMSITKEVFSLEKEEILEEKDINIGEILFKKIPEVYINRKGAYVSDIFLRGFGRENINVFIDGSRVYGACPNGMDPPNFFVRSNEIIGVKIRIGSTDIENLGSLGGSVNIITKQPDKEKISFEINNTAGSFGLSRNRISLNLKGILYSFFSEYAKPYETGEGKKITEYLSGMSAYQDRYKNTTAFDIKQNALKYAYNNIYLYIAEFYSGNILYPYLLMDSVRDHSTRFFLRYKKDTLSITSYYWYINHNMSDTYRKSAVKWTDGTYSTRGYMMKTLAVSRGYGTKIIKSFSNIKTGIDTFIRKWKADNTIMNINNKGMIPDVKMFNIGLFIKGEKQIKSIKILSGIRLDHVYSKANFYSMGANKNLYSFYYGNVKLDTEFNYISGFLELSSKLQMNTDIKLALGQSIRYPNPQELFIALVRPMSKPNWIGNPYLKPTKNREIKLSLTNKTGKSNLSGQIFFSDLKDYIYLSKITGIKPAMSYKNIDAYMYGFSTSFYYVINENLTFSFGASYQIGKKKEGEDKDLPEIPPLKLVTQLTYDKNNLSISLQNIYSARQNNVDSQLNEQPTKSWNIINLKISYTMKNIDITFGIDNLFNKFYYLHLSYLRNPFNSGSKVPEPGRFVYLSMNTYF